MSIGDRAAILQGTSDIYKRFNAFNNTANNRVDALLDAARRELGGIVENLLAIEDAEGARRFKDVYALKAHITKAEPAEGENMNANIDVCQNVSALLPSLDNAKTVREKLIAFADVVETLNDLAGGLHD